KSRDWRSAMRTHCGAVLMGERSAERRPAGKRQMPLSAPLMLRVASLWLCLATGGCMSAVEGPLIFSDAGKYQYHNCDQLAAAARTQAAREQELKALID